MNLLIVKCHMACNQLPQNLAYVWEVGCFIKPFCFLNGTFLPFPGTKEAGPTAKFCR